MMLKPKEEKETASDFWCAAVYITHGKGNTYENLGSLYYQPFIYSHDIFTNRNTIANTMNFKQLLLNNPLITTRWTLIQSKSFIQKLPTFRTSQPTRGESISQSKISLCITYYNLSVYTTNNQNEHPSSYLPYKEW